MAACALAILGPVIAHLLISALIPATRCGKWGLDCGLYLFLGAAASWCAGAVLAVLALRRGEARWAAVSGLIVNLLPLGAFVAFALRILIR